MAVLAPTAALADDESATDDVDTSESTTTVPAVETTTTPPVDDPAPAEAAEGVVEEDLPSVEVTPPAQDEPTLLVEDETGEEDTDRAARSEVAAVDDVIVPDLGFGKTSQPVRVGVDLAEGAYVPAGVTTAGSRLRITETGPDVDGGTRTTDCTTDASTAEGTATFCILDQPDPPEAPVMIIDFPGLPPIFDVSTSQARGAVGPMAVVTPQSPDRAQRSQLYFAERSSTVTVTQVSAASGLVADPESAVVPACGSPQLGESLVGDLPGFDANISGPGVDDEFIDFVRQAVVETILNPCTRQVALLEDTGLPPVAADDRATTREDTPVAIDVLANDDTVAGAPLTGFDFASAPGNGSVEIVGTDAAPQVRYTPDAGFSGTDTFTYGISTPNGTAFAEVTVVVVPDPEPASNDQVAPATVSGLPDAGGPGLSMLGWAAALLASGAGLLTIGRRRRATS